MSMNAEDWRKVEKGLASLIFPVKLKIDEYDVELYLARVAQMRNAIAIRINGKGLECLDFDRDSEERRRFCWRRESYLFSVKQRKAWKKMSKAAQRELSRKYKLSIDEKHISYWPFWTSFRTMKAHLIKNNTSIELVSIH